jgi:hypothetical protein
MTIILRPPPSREEVELILPFNPPLRNAFEIRSRIRWMRETAYKHYEVVCPCSSVVTCIGAHLGSMLIGTAPSPPNTLFHPT